MTAPDLLEVQVGEESSYGTPVAPTHRLMGVELGGASIAPGYTGEIYQEERKSLSPGFNAGLNRTWGVGSIPLQIGYGKDLIWFLNALFAEDAAPVGTDPYTWTYVAPSSAAPASKSLTIVRGGPDGAYSLAGAVGQALTLSCETGGRMMGAVDLIAKSFQVDTLETLSDTAINPVMGHHMSQISIDALGGTIGTTAFSDCAFGFEMQITSGRDVKQCLGSLSASNYNEGKWTGTLNLRLEFDTASKAIYDAIVGVTNDPVGRLVRIDFADGADEFQIDFAGIFIEAPPPFEEFERSLMVNLKFDGLTDNTYGNWCGIEIINTIASL